MAAAKADKFPECLLIAAASEVVIKQQGSDALKDQMMTLVDQNFCTITCALTLWRPSTFRIVVLKVQYLELDGAVHFSGVPCALLAKLDLISPPQGQPRL
jgi:hypothetical protein